MKQERDRLHELCHRNLGHRGFGSDELYVDRLKKELKEIDAQGEHEYLLALHDKFQAEKLIFPINEHNNLVDWLLELASQFDIAQPGAYVQGEAPDIDIDYLKDVRDKLKRVWAPETFGQEYVCEIGTYGTTGIKSAILDMSRIHGMPKDEIQSITVKMKDKFQDDEGNTQDLEWEDALEIYPEFKAYCEKYPEVSDAAYKLLERNKTGGVHAGGLIISSERIDGFVPLEVRMVNKDNPNGVICSAWTEGLKRQDLGPVGLIKFDLLVINNLMQIALGCKLVKERHGIEKISAVPGSWDWSDISYLNDPLALAMADKADLKGIFQFDSEGIRRMVKRGGISNFDDLAAYSALYRPGPLNMGMDVHYCKRKRGEEPYNIHPVIEPYLKKTYGVLVFQEQIMDILRVVGEIPDAHTEKVRKAISKKKKNQFEKYKEMFIENGQRVLNVNADYVINLWDQIESFAKYGFNACMTIRTKITSSNGPKEIQDFVPGDRVHCVDQLGNTVETEVVKLHDHGEIEGFEVTFDDGYKVVCSANHKFLTEEGQISLREICKSRLSILSDQQDRSVYAKETRRGVEESVRDGLSEQETVARASNGLRELQTGGEKSALGEIQACGSLWGQVLDKDRSGFASSAMRQMQAFGVEEVHGDTCGSVRPAVQLVEGPEFASTRVRGMRVYQEEQYRDSHGEAERGQFASGQEEDLFRHGQKNLGETGDTGRSFGVLEEMAGSESREVSPRNSKGLVYSETVPHGELVEGPTRMGLREDSLRRRPQTSRSSEGQDLDRGGRVLPLLRTSEQFGESIPFAEGSGTGSDVERGVRQQSGRDVASLEHGVLPFFDGGDEAADLGLGAGHAPISDTGRLVRRKVVRVVPVGKCHMFDLEVANPTHNFLLPNGVVTSNSHAYAYSYISARLLWLKSHYPIEFYTAILMCEKDDEKFKEYKLDAKHHGVKINPVHINKSRENFAIHDNEIYFGFSNMKHVGDGVAQRIVENQPYKNFPDFLDRFGTDTTPIKALTSLGVFEESQDRLTLRKFAEWYKKQVSNRKDRKKRFQNSMEQKLKELKSKLLEEMTEDDPDFEKMNDYTPEAEAMWEKRFEGIKRLVPYKYKGEERTREVSFFKQLQDLSKRRAKSIEEQAQKEIDEAQAEVGIDSFNTNSIKIDPEEEEILTDELEIAGVKSFPKAESQYYGFQWTHVLETCSDYAGRTIDSFLEECEADGLTVGMIEVEIKNVRRRESKKGVVFYSIDIEDANGKTMVVNVWTDDWIRFQDDLKVGNLVKMRVRPPSGGFNTMTFDSVPRHERRKLPPKEEDHRLLVMTPPVRVKKKTEKDFLNEIDEMKFDPNAIDGLEEL
jgi:hypothetical protein